MTALLRQDLARPEENAATPPLRPPPQPAPSKIDKSQLAIAEPKRLRDKAHLKFVASQPCLVCGRQPSDPHHLRFANRGPLGLKVSDEFTVPLCRGHHRQLHQAGNEKAWWEELGDRCSRGSSTVFGSKAISYPRPGKPLATQTQRDGSRRPL